MFGRASDYPLFLIFMDLRTEYSSVDVHGGDDSRERICFRQRATDASGVPLSFHSLNVTIVVTDAYQQVLDWKIKYEESDNPMVRASRLLTEKVGSLFGNMFEKTELSKTLTEICKIDPNFTATSFLQDCASDIIPNILEAMVRGDLDILKDWCYEGVFNILATPIKQCKTLGYHLDSKILDIEQIDLVMGKMMDQGPVLVITFQSQQIMCVRDAKNNVVEGDPDKVMRVNYVWVLCRDPQELNPKAAWRLLELSANSVEQLI